MKKSDLIKTIALSGKIFTVEFTKADGSITKRNGRTHVHKHTTGGELKYNPADHNLINFYSFTDKGYRSFNIDKVKSIKCGMNFIF